MKSTVRKRPRYVPVDPLTPHKVMTRVSSGRDLLPDIDGRTWWARRVRDLIALHATDLGGEDHVSEAKRSLIRRAAVLTSRLEQMEMKFAEGDDNIKLMESYQRGANTLRRLLQAIGMNRVPRDITPSPLDYANGAAE
jgi:hypothetical protein